MSTVFDKAIGSGGGAVTFQSRNQMSSLAFIREVEFYMRQRASQSVANPMLSSREGDWSIELTVNHNLLEVIDDYSFYDSANLASRLIRSS